MCPGSSELHEEEVPRESALPPSDASASDEAAAEAPPPRMRWVGAGDEFGAARSVYHCNRAACLQQMGRDDEAIGECSVAVALDPVYVKAFVRRGQVRPWVWRLAGSCGITCGKRLPLR